jgi:hypothetical protein
MARSANALVSIALSSGGEIMTKKRCYVISTAALLLSILLPVRAAENDTVQAIIPWEASGRVFQVDTSTMLFLGAFTGVMYIESSQGEMHEAFVMCPITQKVNLKTSNSEAVGYCEISASPENVAYAELTCDGEVGSCDGTFKLIDGEGEFTGISGAGALRVRSPMRALITDVAAGAELRVASGLAVIKDLEYSIP